MPNHASAKKRARQNIKRDIRRTDVRSSTRTAVKKARSAISSGNKETAIAALRDVTKKLDSAASKGVIHRNNAARRISRLTRQVNALS